MKHNYKIRLHSWVWDLHVHTAIFKMDNQQGPTYCVAQETLLNVRWQPRTEGSLGENGYMYVYGWVSLLSTWNYPNIVNQLLNWIELKVTQSCPTLWDPIDYTVHGILQARILEWVVFPFSRGSSQPRDQTQVSCIAGRFFTNWAIREGPCSNPKKKNKK